MCLELFVKRKLLHLPRLSLLRCTNVAIVWDLDYQPPHNRMFKIDQLYPKPESHIFNPRYLKCLRSGIRFGAYDSGPISYKWNTSTSETSSHIADTTAG